MIKYGAKTINLSGQEVPITGFETWFRTPVGLAKTLDIAVSRCLELDFDPDLMIQPVVIAVTANPAVYEEARH